ncbi:hypothetical protein FOXYSP1_02080 [Fusarium oxysporum f. sp. phaseoli]
MYMYRIPQRFKGVGEPRGCLEVLENGHCGSNTRWRISILILFGSQYLVSVSNAVELHVSRRFTIRALVPPSIKISCQNFKPDGVNGVCVN